MPAKIHGPFLWRRQFKGPPESPETHTIKHMKHYRSFTTYKNPLPTHVPPLPFNVPPHKWPSCMFTCSPYTSWHLQNNIYNHSVVTSFCHRFYLLLVIVDQYFCHNQFIWEFFLWARFPPPSGNAFNVRQLLKCSQDERARSKKENKR